MFGTLQRPTRSLRALKRCHGILVVGFRFGASSWPHGRKKDCLKDSQLRPLLEEILALFFESDALLLFAGGATLYDLNLPSHASVPRAST